ncbi:MAG TPA: NAD(P)/FAD-dependent oxidoreductase [Micromonosporaceae bacterium]|nr:NAD(P)/FAD-dependent oxidoreductase [Micromonosporaceae bacterium]
MTTHDVIVIGARVGGAATALLLARRGFRVLLVDRAAIGSDTLSTHQVQLPGVALLKRWGLLDRITASGAAATTHVRFDTGGVVLDGRYPRHDGVDALYSPRRTVLDALLVEAAQAAGVDVRDRFTVDDLVWTDGRVCGIRGSTRGGIASTETARLVVGADGKHSTVAAAVRAGRYRERPARSVASYSYFAGVPMRAGELYQRPDRAVAVFPTNDDLTMVYVAAPIAEFGALRSDLEAAFLRTLDDCGDLGDRVRAGVRAERLRTTPDLPNVFRVPYGPGWALVGDAGLVMDPMTGQGIGNALRDAAGLVDAVASGLGDERRLRAALARHHRDRDRAIGPMYDLTMRISAFRAPSAPTRRLYAALAGNPEETSRFLGMLAGVVPVREYLSIRNVLRIVLGSRHASTRTADVAGAR